MLKNYFWVIILLFLTIFSFIFADMTVSAIKGKLSKPELDTPVSDEASTIKKKKTREGSLWKKKRLMKMKNIFNSESDFAEIEETVVKDSKEPMKTEDIGGLTASALPFRLLGIAYGPPDLAAAVIYNGTEQDVYKVNDSLNDHAKLVKIERERIILDNKGNYEYIKLETDSELEKASKKTRSKSRKSKGDEDDRKEKKDFEYDEGSAASYQISKREKQDAFENMGKLMTQIRVVPNLKRGKIDGFRVFEIRKDSIFMKAGLRNGDIIKRINGVVIEDAATALKLSEQMKDEDSFSIDLIRKGENMHLDIDIR